MRYPSVLWVFLVSYERRSRKFDLLNRKSLVIFIDAIWYS